MLQNKLLVFTCCPFFRTFKLVNTCKGFFQSCFTAHEYILSLKGIVLETVTTECRRITRKNVCQRNIQDRGFNSPENDTMKL